MSYTIRTMSTEELLLAINLAANEGWNPGLHDAKAFIAADREAFLIGELNGKPIATISSVRYGSTFGFIGFYIVKPEYRGKGYGIAIWKAAIERLSGRNIGLDGVIAQQNNYIKSGFKLAYRNIRYEGRTRSSSYTDENIQKITSDNFNEVESYDAHFFPEPRTSFLKLWLQQPEGVALSYQHNGKITGYGVIRKCLNGYKVGPLFANTPNIAEALFNALQSRADKDKPIFLDIPETNQEAIKLVERHKMTVSFETARMYTREVPDLNIQNTYGVTTFELG